MAENESAPDTDPLGHHNGRAREILQHFLAYMRTTGVSLPSPVRDITEQEQPLCWRQLLTRQLHLRPQAVRSKLFCTRYCFETLRADISCLPPRAVCTPRVASSSLLVNGYMKEPLADHLLVR